MKTICSDFMGSFRLGDNIVHNLGTLKVLYEVQNNGSYEVRKFLRKPIIVTIGSIAEAVLYDLYLRINSYVLEGVPNIPESVIEEIRTKTIDEFAKYITNAKSKNLLGEDPSIYDALDELRKLRNRVHIQNSKNHFESGEWDAFSLNRQRSSEKTLERLLTIMESKYTRKGVGGFVGSFELPWEPHIKAQQAADSSTTR
ncbi:MAG: hypothetical protein AB3N64_12105 [Puniceicoccaceae bacterium]